jgi:hypothetical protein
LHVNLTATTAATPSREDSTNAIDIDRIVAAARNPRK